MLPIAQQKHIIPEEKNYIPMINVIHYFVRFSVIPHSKKNAFNPSYVIIFENALDDLVQKIRRNELVYICSREVIGERLTTKLDYTSVITATESSPQAVL